MSETKARLCLTATHEAPQERKPPRIEDPKKVEETILANVQMDCTFIPFEFPGTYLDQFEESGVLHRRFLLSHVRAWCGLNEADDDLILSVMDSVARRGRLKLFRVELTRDMHYNDIGFSVEVGRSVRTYQGLDVGRIVSTRFYSNEPLRKREHDRHTILNIRERVSKIRQQRDEHFRRIFGESGLEIESRLHREDVEDEARLKRSVEEAIQLMKGKKGK